MVHSGGAKGKEPLSFCEELGFVDFIANLDECRRFASDNLEEQFAKIQIGMFEGR